MHAWGKSIGSFVFAGALAGVVAFSLPASVQAHRLTQPQTEKNVTLPGTREVQQPSGVRRPVRPTSEGTTRVVPRDDASKGSLQDRIQAILHPVEEPADPVQPQFQVPKTVSAYDDAILGTPLATEEQCVKYLLAYNPAPDISCTPQQLVAFYYQEGAREGIRPDVAFAQALKETGFFRYGGDVVPAQNNYCGLGTTGGGVRGAYFATPQLGVRAHIQHLLAYASTREPQEAVVDPRYQLVRGTYGDTTLGAWEDLNGRWAVPGNSYGQSILSMFRAILSE